MFHWRPERLFVESDHWADQWDHLPVNSVSYHWASLWTAVVYTQISCTASFKSSPRGTPLFEVVRPYKDLDLYSAADAARTQDSHSRQLEGLFSSHRLCLKCGSNSVLFLMRQKDFFVKQSHRVPLWCCLIGLHSSMILLYSDLGLTQLNVIVSVGIREHRQGRTSNSQIRSETIWPSSEQTQSVTNNPSLHKSSSKLNKL